MTTLLEGHRLKLASQVLVVGEAKHQLTVLSPVHLVLRGDKDGQVVALPSALTLKEGWIFIITNNSSQPVMVRDFVGNLICLLGSEERLEVQCLANTTPKGEWCKSIFSIGQSSFADSIFSASFYGTGTVDGVGQWLFCHPAVDSSKTPFLVPFQVCHLIGASLSSSGDQKKAPLVHVYKNGTSDLNLAAVQSTEAVDPLCVLFKKNDRVAVYLKAPETADNPLASLYFKVVKP